jgi:hypothetical protein
MSFATVSLAVTVLAAGLLFFRIHTLPERMAHKSKKLQFELIAVLGLLSLFTHEHGFWVAGLLLAFIDLPDFGTPARRAVVALETMAGIEPPPATAPAAHAHEEPPLVSQGPALASQEKQHA